MFEVLVYIKVFNKGIKGAWWQEHRAIHYVKCLVLGSNEYTSIKYSKSSGMVYRAEQDLLWKTQSSMLPGRIVYWYENVTSTPIDPFTLFRGK